MAMLSGKRVWAGHVAREKDRNGKQHPLGYFKELVSKMEFYTYNKHLEDAVFNLFNSMDFYTTMVFSKYVNTCPISYKTGSVFVRK